VGIADIARATGLTRQPSSGSRVTCGCRGCVGGLADNTHRLPDGRRNRSLHPAAGRMGDRREADSVSVRPFALSLISAMPTPGLSGGAVSKKCGLKPQMASPHFLLRVHFPTTLKLNTTQKYNHCVLSVSWSQAREPVRQVRNLLGKEASHLIALTCNDKVVLALKDCARHWPPTTKRGSANKAERRWI